MFVSIALEKSPVRSMINLLLAIVEISLSKNQKVAYYRLQQPTRLGARRMTKTDISIHFGDEFANEHF